MLYAYSRKAFICLCLYILWCFRCTLRVRCTTFSAGITKTKAHWYLLRVNFKYLHKISCCFRIIKRAKYTILFENNDICFVNACRNNLVWTNFCTFFCFFKKKKKEKKSIYRRPLYSWFEIFQSCPFWMYPISKDGIILQFVIQSEESLLDSCN